MDKDDFYAVIRKDLKLAYPEKTDDEINKMIDKSYDKFKDVADRM